MSSECSVCGKQGGGLPGARVSKKNEIEALRRMGVTVPDNICYDCLASLRDKSAKTGQPEIRTRSSMKSFGKFLFFLSAVFFIIAIFQNTDPGYMSLRAAGAERAIYYRIVFSSLSGSCLFLGSIFYSVGTAINTISRQNETIISLLKKQEAAMPECSPIESNEKELTS